MKKKEVKFIDLFAGIGATRVGLEKACEKMNLNSKCVFTSEIKKHAINVYSQNFPNEPIYGDITKIHSKDIPDFDILLGGFPCQTFSSAGKRAGFMDTRGTLFFEVQRILSEKKPSGFILENVEGLVNHDKRGKKKEIGRTLETILCILEKLNYNVSWKVLNAIDHGVPQNRKRVFIVGHKKGNINLEFKPYKQKKLKHILEKGKPLLNTKFTKSLLSHYPIHQLAGKSIKDKRGGEDNIHSWNLELKGDVSNDQKELLELLLRARRKKKWAIQKGIAWMDGMPLTKKEIETFYQPCNLFQDGDLQGMLNDLVEKGYLVYEYPKDLVEFVDEYGNKKTERRPVKHIEKGYNIVAGKLSFEISKILDPEDIAPTLVATDVSRLAVIDGNGLRRLTKTEGLCLFGFDNTYKADVDIKNLFDLLGNTMIVPIVKDIALRLLELDIKK